VAVAAALQAISPTHACIYAVAIRALLVIITLTYVRDDTPASADIATPPETLVIVTAATVAWRATTAIAGDALVII